MRKNQLRIALERFGDESKNGTSECFGVYSDGNELPAVLARALEKLREEYYPDLGWEDFCNMLAEQDVKAPFFGRCEVMQSKSAAERRVEIL